MIMMKKVTKEVCILTAEVMIMDTHMATIMDTAMQEVTEVMEATLHMMVMTTVIHTALKRRKLVLKITGMRMAAKVRTTIMGAVIVAEMTTDMHMEKKTMDMLMEKEKIMDMHMVQGKSMIMEMKLLM